jgi:hypothetical protein
VIAARDGRVGGWAGVPARRSARSNRAMHGSMATTQTVSNQPNSHSVVENAMTPT